MKDVLLELLVLLYAWQWELYSSYIRSFVTPTDYIIDS